MTMNNLIWVLTLGIIPSSDYDILQPILRFLSIHDSSVSSALRQTSSYAAFISLMSLSTASLSDGRPLIHFLLLGYV